MKSQTTRMKSEPMTPDTRVLKRKKAVSDSSSEDEKPLAFSPAKSRAVPMPGAVETTVANGKRASRNTKTIIESEDDDDDAPLAKPKRAANGKGKAVVNGKGKGKPPKKKVKKESESEPDIESEDGTPAPPPKKAPAKGKRKVKEESDADDESYSDDDKPLKKRAATATKKTPVSKKAPATKKVKAEASDDVKPKKRGAKKEESSEPASKKGKAKKEEEAEDTYKWWEEQNANRDGSVKWQTLEHNGVYFPQPYEPLPQHVKMKYNGAYCTSSAKVILVHSSAT